MYRELTFDDIIDIVKLIPTLSESLPVGDEALNVGKLIPLIDHNIDVQKGEINGWGEQNEDEMLNLVHNNLFFDINMKSNSSMIIVLDSCFSRRSGFLLNSVEFDEFVNHHWENFE